MSDAVARLESVRAEIVRAARDFGRDPASSAMTVKRARCLVAELLGVTLPSDEVRIKGLSLLDLPFGSESSALIESSIRVDFRERWYHVGISATLEGRVHSINVLHDGLRHSRLGEPRCVRDCLQ